MPTLANLSHLPQPRWPRNQPAHTSLRERVIKARLQASRLFLMHLQARRDTARFASAKFALKSNLKGAVRIVPLTSPASIRAPSILRLCGIIYADLGYRTQLFLQAEQARISENFCTSPFSDGARIGASESAHRGWDARCFDCA